MNTIATLDLLPAPRKSLTSAARGLVRRFLGVLSAKAPMASVPAGLILVKRDSHMVHARKPGSLDVVVWPVPLDQPEIVRWDVCQAVWAAQEPNRYAECNSRPVELSACLMCDWTGHVS